MLDNNIDWCDVDSDEEYCIPLLPPLPLVDLLCFPQADAKKVELRATRSSGTSSGTSETSSSTAGSRQTSADEAHGHKTSDRQPSYNDRVETNLKIKKTSVVGKFPRPASLKNEKTTEWVCFIGKFPKLTTIDDMISFVKSTGINFTEIRMGPKKNIKKIKNAFGYVDLPTKNDFDKLLTLDGTLYEGRKIRVDRANHKKSATHRMVLNAKNRKTQITRKRKQTDVSASRSRTYQQKDRRRFHDIQSNPIVGKKMQVVPKSSSEPKRPGYKKVTARSQRWKKIMFNHGRGQRYKHMYVKTSNVSGAFVNSSSRTARAEG
jgi:hypothetical protein